MYKKAHTPFSWHKDAFKLAKKLKTTLFSSPFSERAVDLLEKYKVSWVELSPALIRSQMIKDKKKFEDLDDTTNFSSSWNIFKSHLN